MFSQHKAAECCSGLSVHTSGQCVQESVSFSPPKTDPASPDNCVTAETSQPLPVTGKTSQLLPVTEKTSQPLSATEKISQPLPVTEKLGFQCQPGFDDDVDFFFSFSLDSWIQDLNRSLQDHQGNIPAQISRLTQARQDCDIHIKQLTDDFHRTQSDTLLTTKLPEKKNSSATTKKARRKEMVRMFDDDLRTVNKKVNGLMLVRREVESRLKLLLAGSQQKDQQQQKVVPIQTMAELKAAEAAKPRPEKNEFCKDVIVCVFLSCLVFYLMCVFMALF